MGVYVYVYVCACVCIHLLQRSENHVNAQAHTLPYVEESVLAVYHFSLLSLVQPLPPQQSYPSSELPSEPRNWPARSSTSGPSHIITPHYTQPIPHDGVHSG